MPEAYLLQISDSEGTELIPLEVSNKFINIL
jgi:hypothetical protein